MPNTKVISCFLVGRSGHFRDIPACSTDAMGSIIFKRSNGNGRWLIIIKWKLLINTFFFMRRAIRVSANDGGFEEKLYFSIYFSRWKVVSFIGIFNFPCILHSNPLARSDKLINKIWLVLRLAYVNQWSNGDGNDTIETISYVALGMPFVFVHRNKRTKWNGKYTEMEFN